MENLLNRITINPEQCGGRPCIRGMRIRVLADGLRQDQDADAPIGQVHQQHKRKKNTNDSGNELVHKGVITGDRYKLIDVRRIELRWDLDYASKLDRDPTFIRALMAYGRAEAEVFLKQQSAK